MVLKTRSDKEVRFDVCVLGASMSVQCAHLYCLTTMKTACG